MLDRLRHLVPLELTVIGPAARRVWPSSLHPITKHWIADPTDTGVTQSDDVTVDRDATRESLERWLAQRESIVARESARLRGRFDLVLGDVPALAFEAARRVEIRSVALANFSWDWIYGELGFADAAAETARAYAHADLLLEAVPFAPMDAFARRVNVGLVAREPSHRRGQGRAALGVADGESLVLVAFQPTSAPGLVLPAPKDGRSYAVPSGWPAREERPDVRRLPADMRFEDAIGAADVVLGKPGYGLIGDVEAAGTRFLYVARPAFPENEVLERHLAGRDATVALDASLLATGDWNDALAEIERARPPQRADAGGAERAAREIAAMLEVDSGRSRD